MATKKNEKKVFLSQPKAYEDLKKTVAAMDEQQAVLLILTDVDPDLKRRMLDFIAGAAYGMRQNIERIANDVILITPPGTVVADELASAAARAGEFLSRDGSVDVPEFKI